MHPGNESAAPNRSPRRVLVAAALALVGWAWLSPAFAGPRAYSHQQTRYRIRIQPVTVQALPGAEPSHVEILLDGRSKPEGLLTLAWPDGESRSRLRLSAKRGTPGASLAHAIDVDAELTLPDGLVVHAAHHAEFDETGTGLFEVYRLGDRSLTLVVEAAAEIETVFSRHPEVGAPVRFVLEIQRVEEGRVIVLESNELRTLLGEPVSYSFRLGRDRSVHAVEIRIAPVRLTGALLETEIDISGRLPGEEGPWLASRRERWIASRGAASTIALESGEPPTGYRFVVRADY